MNLDDIKDILDLMREHELVEFELERDGLKVRVRKASHHLAITPPSVPMTAPLPATPATPAAPVQQPPAAENNQPVGGVDLAVIKSPIVGTLYRSSEPGARPFAEIGDTIRKGQVLCIIEAMKLMNEIESDCDGELAAIYVENGQPVQFGDRLFAIRVAS